MSSLLIQNTSSSPRHDRGWTAAAFVLCSVLGILLCTRRGIDYNRTETVQLTKKEQNEGGTSLGSAFFTFEREIIDHAGQQWYNDKTNRSLSENRDLVSRFHCYDEEKP